MTYFFVDKCLPFGASISCAHFQRFSNALRHLVQHRSGKNFHITNYLDNFLFVELTKDGCNELVWTFLEICKEIRLPVTLDKTDWGSSEVIFLGILLDGFHHSLSVPIDKKETALTLLNYFLNKKKTTVKHLQSLTGYLNFLSKAIFPGRTFTRRMYSKYSTILGDKTGKHKSYHHV